MKCASPPVGCSPSFCARWRLEAMWWLSRSWSFFPKCLFLFFLEKYIFIFFHTRHHWSVTCSEIKLSWVSITNTPNLLVRSHQWLCPFIFIDVYCKGWEQKITAFAIDFTYFCGYPHFISRLRFVVHLTIMCFINNTWNLCQGSLYLFWILCWRQFMWPNPADRNNWKKWIQWRLLEINIIESFSMLKKHLKDWNDHKCMFFYLFIYLKLLVKRG